jgi:FKBP-type peptidyl-prolyl cis-trans isomerase (trigger factor)
LTEYSKRSGYDDSKIESELFQDAQNQLFEELVCKEIVKQEKIAINESDFSKALNQFMKEFQVTTDMISKSQERYLTYIYRLLEKQKVQE